MEFLPILIICIVAALAAGVAAGAGACVCAGAGAWVAAGSAGFSPPQAHSASVMTSARMIAIHRFIPSPP